MKEKQNVNTGAVESVGTKKQTKTFDEILTNKEYQAEFDRRVQKAIKTAKIKWDESNNSKKSEKVCIQIITGGM